MNIPGFSRSSRSAVLTDVLGGTRSPVDDGSLFTYRVLLLVAAVLFPAFGLLYAQIEPARVDPFWLRGLLAVLAGGIAGTSYLFRPVRARLGRLMRACIYLLVPWCTGLLLANDYAGSYALGLLFLHGASGLAFGTGLSRIRPLGWFLGVSTGVPLLGSLWISTPETPPIQLALTLGGLALLIYVVTRQRIRSERHLRASRSRYQRLHREFETIIEAAQDAVFLVEVRRKNGEVRFELVRLNPHHEKLTGLRTDEVRGRSPREVLGEQVGAAVETRYRTCLEGGESIEYEEELPAPAGTRRWHTKLAPVRQNGKIVMLVGVARDITDRIRRENELRAREQQLEQIRQNVTDVVWMSTPEKETMEFISEAYERVWGRPVEEVKNRPTSFLDGVHPDDRERVVSAVSVQRKDPESYRETYRVVRPDGETRWVRDRAAGVYDENGELVRIVGIATDVTDRKRRDEQLRLLDRIIQHDLRSEVANAQGWAGLLESGKDRASVARRIQHATGHMLEILEAARAVQRALRSGQRMNRESVPLVDHVEQAVQTVERRFPTATIVTDLASCGNVRFLANELLESVFENLIANGVRHNDRARPEVTVRIAETSDSVEVTVADDGPGIPPDERAAIFEEGRCGLDSPGMGLGLYLVDTLVRQYGGRIEVSENEPRGTRFIVRLTRAKKLERHRS